MYKKLIKLFVISFISILSASAMAQNYPSKPIRLIVGFPPGSAIDHIARVLEPHLSKGLGQPIIVDNIVGASGISAANTAARANPDGYTIMLSVPGSMTIAPAVRKDNLRYSPEMDFEPIGLIGKSPLLLVVSNQSQIKTIDELADLAKKTTGGLNISTYGAGSPAHFAFEMFKLKSQLPISHIPFNGSPASMTALIGGQVHAAFESVSAAIPFITSGKIRALAVTSRERIAALNEIKTFEEVGTGLIEVGGWAALHAPAGTPKPVINILNKELNNALNSSEIQKKLNDRIIITGGPPDILLNHVKRETEIYKTTIKEANLALD